MPRKITFLVACIALTALAGSAAAQAPAAFLFRSGERVNGDLIDLNSTNYLITVNGQERRVGLDELAVIDFVGGGQNFPEAEVSKLLPGQNLLVLRDGQMFAGRMADVGGTRPKRINFAINGEARDFTSDQVARIYLTTPPSAAPAPSAPAQPDKPGTVHVVANRQWTPAGITVQRGQVLRFSSTGQVRLSLDPNDTAPVTGRPGREVGPRGSLPSTLGGALIGRIGNGRPFGIGDQTTIVAPSAGPLYLGVNDDEFTDNGDEFVVVITVGTELPTRNRRR